MPPYIAPEHFIHHKITHNSRQQYKAGPLGWQRSGLKIHALISRALRRLALERAAPSLIPAPLLQFTGPNLNWDTSVDSGASVGAASDPLLSWQDADGLVSEGACGSQSLTWPTESRVVTANQQDASARAG